MLVTIGIDGAIEWEFYRKSYKKARWRKAAQRQIETMRELYPDSVKLIVVC